MGSICRALWRKFELYNDENREKRLHRYNRFFGLGHRFLQAVSLAIIGVVLVWRRDGYQLKDERPLVIVATKTEGVATFLPNLNSNSNTNSNSNSNTSTTMIPLIMDTADILVPPQMNSAVFITTNFVHTPNQKLGECPAAVSSRAFNCSSAADCNPATKSSNQGILTGKCVQHGGSGGGGGGGGKGENTSSPATNGLHTQEAARGVWRCQIRGWCPAPEHPPIGSASASPSSPAHTVIPGIINMTVYVKNNIVFRAYNVTRSNILTNFTRAYLAACRYDPAADPFCPVFRLGDILRLSGVRLNAANRDDNGNGRDDNNNGNSSGNGQDERILQHGGLVSMLIEWDCDLDAGEHSCLPRYRFRRMDKLEIEDSEVRGFHIHYASHFTENQRELTRTLYRLYGIKMIISVEGVARKSEAATIVKTFGSGLSYVAIARLVVTVLVSLFAKQLLVNSGGDGERDSGEHSFEGARSTAGSTTENTAGNLTAVNATRSNMNTPTWLDCLDGTAGRGDAKDVRLNEIHKKSTICSTPAIV